METSPSYARHDAPRDGEPIANVRTCLHTSSVAPGPRSASAQLAKDATGDTRSFTAPRVARRTQRKLEHRWLYGLRAAAAAAEFENRGTRRHRFRDNVALAEIAQKRVELDRTAVWRDTHTDSFAHCRPT